MHHIMRLSKTTMAVTIKHLQPLLDANNIVTSEVTLRSSRSFGTENILLRDDTEEELPRVKDGCLALTVTPDLEQEIVGDNVGQIFMLKQVLSEIIRFENQKMPMPLPPSLTVEQWRQLVSLTNRKSRFHLLDCLLHGEMTWEQIQSYDDQLSKPIEVSEDLINEVCQDDEEKRRKISLFLWFYEEKRQEG